MTKLKFHSFEALRFFAFFKVYLLHIPIQGNFPVFSYLKYGGGIGVYFFFVLSGFLITYLLTFEKLKDGHINIKRFLVRRSLRIWPLFYLMLVLAYALPYDFKQLIGFHMVGGGYDLDWKFSYFFLDNIKALIMDRPPKTTPLPVFWSLCIEVHFYVFWILILGFIKEKHYLKFFVLCFGIAWLSRYFEPMLLGNNNIDRVDLFTNIDLFAAGGILGYLVAKDYLKVERFIENIPVIVRWILLFAIIAMVVFQKNLLPKTSDTLIVVFRASVIALLFTILLALFIPKKSPIKIKSRLLNYLGERSYGLYVYHIIWIHVVFQVFIYFKIRIDDWLTLAIYMIVTFVGSVVVSILSYKYFEKYFLLYRTESNKAIAVLKPIVVPLKKVLKRN